MTSKYYEILQSDDIALRSVADAVLADEIDIRFANVCVEMFRTMKNAEGIGLAATQIGWKKRLFVFGSDLIENEETKENLTDESLLLSDEIAVVINPVIINRKGLVSHEEGCLSVFGLLRHVPRSESVSVECWNIRGEYIKFSADGLFGYLVQHETDHLNGILINDIQAGFIY